MILGINEDTLNIIAYILLILGSFLTNFFIRNELFYHYLRLGIIILPISPYHNEFFYFIETVRPFIFGIAILLLITTIALLIFAFFPQTNFFDDLTKEKSTSLVVMSLTFILAVCTTLVSVFILGGGATGALITGAILSFPVLFVLSVVFYKKIIKFKFLRG